MVVDWIPAESASSRSDCAAPEVRGSRGSPDPVIAAMLSTVSASAGRAMQIWRTTLNGREMTSSHDLKVTMAEMLHRTVDGRGLALS